MENQPNKREQAVLNITSTDNLIRLDPKLNDELEKKDLELSNSDSKDEYKFQGSMKSSNDPCITFEPLRYEYSDSNLNLENPTEDKIEKTTYNRFTQDDFNLHIQNLISVKLNEESIRIREKIHEEIKITIMNEIESKYNITISNLQKEIKEINDKVLNYENQIQLMTQMIDSYKIKIKHHAEIKNNFEKEKKEINDKLEDKISLLMSIINNLENNLNKKIEDNRDELSSRFLK